MPGRSGGRFGPGWLVGLRQGCWASLFWASLLAEVPSGRGGHHWGGRGGPQAGQGDVGLPPLSLLHSMAYSLLFTSGEGLGAAALSPGLLRMKAALLQGDHTDPD